MSVEIRERPHARSVVVASAPGIGRLTPREREILTAVCEHGYAGATNVVFVEYVTLKNTLSSVFRKLGIAGMTSGKIGRACYLLGRADR